MKTRYQLIMDHIKKLLKKMHVTYPMLANTLNVPESTLKKWFNAPDGSFNRIQKICEAIGVPMHAILKQVEESELKTFSFDKPQQDYFLKDKRGFDVYWLLVYERRTEAKVMELVNLSPTEFKKIIFKLDKLNLLKLLPGDKIKVPKMRPITWKFMGTFMEGLQKEWTKDLLSDSSKHLLQFFQLTTESEAEFLKDLSLLEEKYARRTILELSLNNKELNQVRYLSALSAGSFIK